MYPESAEEYQEMQNASGEAEMEAQAGLAAQKKVDFSNYKFHPSSLGDIMTESRTKEPLGETCKNHLMECYVREKYGRFKDIANKYIEKGLAVEEDSITLYSRVKKKFFKKNAESIENEFLMGTPDLFEGETIQKATKIIDIKSSWSIHTFFQTMGKAINKGYFWQLQGYMDLTGAKVASLVYCLVNTPEAIVQGEKNSLAWKMAVIDRDSDPLYLMACEAIDKESYFNDIDINDRWIGFEVQRDQVSIDRAHERVKECREFLNKLP